MGPAAAPIMIGLTIASAAATAYGQVRAGQARADAAKSQEEIEKYNQELAEREAKDALKRGKVEEDRQRTIGRLEIGKYRSRAASRGLLVDTGSELEREGDLAASSEYDASVIRRNAEREANRHLATAQNHSMSAGMFNATASSAKTSAAIGAGATLLGAAGKAAGKWNSSPGSGSTT